MTDEKRHVYRAIAPVEPADVEALLSGPDAQVRIETLISLGYYAHPPQWVIDTATPWLFDDDEWVAHGAALALLYLAMANGQARPQLREHARSLLAGASPISQQARDVLDELLTVGVRPPPRWKRWLRRGTGR